MTACEKWKTESPKRIKQAPTLVPLGLILIGLALLPFDCVYNQALALVLIAIGGYSLTGRLTRLVCCMKNRATKLEENPAMDAPRCF